jgi:hypothetical protein
MAGEALALNCAPRPLSFDGFGINGADAYRTRIATFTTGASEALRAEMGPLFAAAPALLAALRDALDDCHERDDGRMGISHKAIDDMRAALRAAGEVA